MEVLAKIDHGSVPEVISFSSFFSTITVWFLFIFFNISKSSHVFLNRWRYFLFIFYLSGLILQVCQSHCYRNVRLPHQLRVSLLQEMETYILEALLDKELEQKLLCDLFYKCALLSSFMFGSYITRSVNLYQVFIYNCELSILEIHLIVLVWWGCVCVGAAFPYLLRTS